MPTPDFSTLSLFPTFSSLPTSPPNHSSPSPSPSPTSPPQTYLVAQIKDDMTITKPTLVLTDLASSPFALVFEGLDRDGLDFKKAGLKKGYTAVIPGDACVKVPPKEEGKRGFVSVSGVEAGRVRGIPGDLGKVREVGGWLRGREAREQGGEGDGERCEVCGKREEGDGGLLKCTGCGEVRYCGKECQIKGWNEGGHKGDCKIIKAIREIWGGE